MADYKEIKGTGIFQYPNAGPPSLTLGDVWYDTSAENLKIQAAGQVGTWATGGTLNTGKDGASSAGIQTAGLVTGGGNFVTAVSNTETYNGSNWTEVNDLNTARWRQAGCGTQTAAIATGGDATGPAPEGFSGAETWNGSNWTEVNDMNANKYGHGAAGTQTAAITFAGDSLPGPNDFGDRLLKTESWNGTNWTEVADMNGAGPGPSPAQFLRGGAGTSTSALAIGGYISPSSHVESWNGTTWTLINRLNRGASRMAASGPSNTDVLAYGGRPMGETEKYNGTSWTELNDMNVPSTDFGGIGTATLALAAGGDNSTNSEEWSESPGTGPFDILFTYS